MAEQIVSLNPGESKLVTFEVIPSEARIYQVTVNGLAGSFVAIVPWQLVPCVYCGATFTTEEELIYHMETNHPNKPYLISGYPEAKEVVAGNNAIFQLKLFIPEWRPSCRTYPFDYFYFRAKIVSPLDYSDEGYITHNGFYPWRSSDFHKAKVALPTDYEYQGYHLLPPGEYSLFAYCGFCGTSGIYTRCGVECHVWEWADTGITVTII